MKQRINKNDPNYISPESPKFLLYSGHDDTLTQMQIFLNKHFNINKEWVPYASNQIFELRKYGNIFHIEVYYNDRLKMNITYEEFKKGIELNVMSDKEIYNICYKFEKDLKIYLIIIFLIIIIVILLIVFIFIIMKVRKEAKYMNYQKVIQIVQ